MARPYIRSYVWKRDLAAGKSKCARDEGNDRSRGEKRGPTYHRSHSAEPRTEKTVKTCAALTPCPYDAKLGRRNARSLSPALSRRAFGMTDGFTTSAQLP